MALDLPKTAAAFVVLIALGAGGLVAAEVMPTDTVVTMVLPSMVAFGLVCLFLGVQYGEYRSART